MRRMRRTTCNGGARYENQAATRSNIYERSISEAGFGCWNNSFERAAGPLAAGLARGAAGRLDAGGEVRAGVVRRRSFELLDGGGFRPVALLFIDLDLVGHR